MYAACVCVCVHMFNPLYMLHVCVCMWLTLYADRLLYWSQLCNASIAKKALTVTPTAVYLLLPRQAYFSHVGHFAPTGRLEQMAVDVYRH